VDEARSNSALSSTPDRFGVTEPVILAMEEEIKQAVDQATETAKCIASARGRVDLQRRLGGWRLGMAELTYREAVARGHRPGNGSATTGRVWARDIEPRAGIQGHGRPAREIRAVASARYADRRAGDLGRRHGRGDDRP